MPCLFVLLLSSHFLKLLPCYRLPPTSLTSLTVFCISYSLHITFVDNASTNAQKTSAGSSPSKLCQESQGSRFRYDYELSVGIGYGVEGEEDIKLPELQQPTSDR